MSEIQDAAQIIKVSFEGAEIILKMGNTGWQFVKDICAVFKKVLDQEIQGDSHELLNKSS